MTDLLNYCLQLRSLVTEVEGAITFNTPLSAVSNIDNRITITENFLNELNAQLTPPTP